MGRRTHIPVTVRRPGGDQTSIQRTQTEPLHGNPSAAEERLIAAREPELQTRGPALGQSAQPSKPTESQPQEASNEWRDRALRLQAEMDNFRKRQRRLAEEQIETERQRLLSTFLGIIDDLERAIASPDGDQDALRQGLQLTHRSALHLMDKEGAEQIEAEGQAFDPTWHEAVATIGRNGTGMASGTVAQVLEPGYRVGSQLLRPAKVIVAV